MMKSVAAQLDEAILAICPISGVSIGDEEDRSTWTIRFSPDATPEQIKAAEQLLATFDPVVIVEPDDPGVIKRR